jgi:hypothetical protein
VLTDWECCLVARAEGWYWVRERTRGVLLIAAYRDGLWAIGDGEDYPDERRVTVIAGPLQPPDPAIGGTWKQRYEKILRERRKIEGEDPTLGWDYIDGYYWVRVQGRSELVLARFMEDAWDEAGGDELGSKSSAAQEESYHKVEVIDGPLMSPEVPRPSQRIRH